MTILVTLAVTVMLVASCMDSDHAAEREALMQADRDFCTETQERGGDGWADWFLLDGVMFPSVGIVEGREAIRARMRQAFTPENPRLLWEPTHATVAASGELGYTYGRWHAMAPASTGSDSVLSTGHYVSIWEKDTDGNWRVALDIGNDDPPPSADAEGQ